MNGHQMSPAQKFQSLLRELFQFDCADLDFGIYRIMNHKRDVVEQFISTKLPAAVDAELGSGTLAQQAEAKAALEEARQLLLKSLGGDALDVHGEVTPELAGTPVAKAYLAAKSRAGASRSREALEMDVYNHLYAFFNRYYQDGDFISRRRYSSNHRYAIPYNGEEVHLHWANSDQYYIKTDEHFHSYQWKSPTGVTVHFGVDVADVEQNNVKGEPRFFVPRWADAEWEPESHTLAVPFDYRPLTAKEQTEYGRGNLQEGIIAASQDQFPEHIKSPDALAALAGERSRNAADEPVTHLEHHLRRYTRRNDSDFFIHKDLRGFLNRELDFYLKNEVLNLDNLEAAGEHAAQGWFQQLRLTKTIGSQIIDFLAQVEGFQKMLWEKRKFITETNYCIAIRCVPDEFFEEIAANEAQWVDWRLHSLVDEKAVNTTGSSATQRERTAYLQAHSTLMLDTAFFDSSFTSELLGSLTDLDDLTDGLLIESENWQALRLLQGSCAAEIKCIYIDPPYNTDASAILYKNGYKDSSWLSLVLNGLTTAKNLLTSDGVLCCAIDDEEAWQLRSIMQSTFDSELGVVPVRSNPAGRKTKGKFSPAHEYAYFFSLGPGTPGPLPKTDKELARYPLEDELGRYAWNNLIRHGSGDRRSDRPKEFFPIYVNAEDRLRVPRMEWNEEDREYRVLDEPTQGEVAVWPIRIEGGERIEKRWHRGPQRVAQTLDEYRVRHVEGSVEIDFKIYSDVQSMPKTWWDDSRYASANQGAKSMKDLFGDRIFDFAKSVHLVEDCLRASVCNEHATVLDYFAGSGTTGHAVINLNRDDGGRRKFILVEMGDHFDTVVIPRLKKVAFSPDWQDGGPARKSTPEEVERSPRIIKYIRLESYEDALDSIEFDQRAGELELEDRIEGYLLNYMLKWETKDSETLLNPSKLATPFDYKLRVHKNGNTVERRIDVAETFNYLLGLKVRTRRVYMDGDRRYLVFRGETRERPGRSAVVIWRDTVDWVEDDLKRDREFVAENGITEGVDTIYVNGMSSIVGGKPVEPLFKERMFAGVSDTSRPTHAKTDL